MTVLRIILVSLVAMVCVVAGEAGLIFWLANAQIDVTGRLFVYGVFPVQLLIIGAATLVLWRIYRNRLPLFAPLFVAIHLVVYATLLRQLSNPWPDVVQYLMTFAVVHAIWLGVFILVRLRAAKGNPQAH